MMHLFNAHINEIHDLIMHQRASDSIWTYNRKERFLAGV